MTILPKKKAEQQKESDNEQSSDHSTSPHGASGHASHSSPHPLESSYDDSFSPHHHRGSPETFYHRSVCSKWCVHIPHDTYIYITLWCTYRACQVSCPLAEYSKLGLTSERTVNQSCVACESRDLPVCSLVSVPTSNVQLVDNQPE